MIFLLISQSISVINNSEKEIKIIYENILNAPASYPVAIPPDADVDVKYRVLEWMDIPRGLKIYSRGENPLSYRIVRGEVDHVLLTFEPIVSENRMPVKWEVIIKPGGHFGRGKGKYRALYRRFINYPFPSWWIKETTRKKVRGFSPDDATYWLKMEIKEPGIYRIDYQDITGAGIPSQDLDFSTFRMLAVIDSLPSSISLVDSGIRDVAFYVHDENGNGMMDPGDYILFYGEGPDGFRNINGSITYYIHPYSNSTFYWLGIGSSIPGKRMDSSNVSSSIPLTALRIFHHEKQLFNPGRKGTAWVGEGMGYGITSFDFDLAGITSPAGTLIVSLVGAENLGDFTGNGTVTITLNGNTISTVNTYEASRRVYTFVVSGLRASGNRLDFRINGNNQMVYLDYFEIRYQGTLPPQGKVFSPTSGTFRVGNSDITLDITDPHSPILLKSSADTTSPGKIYFSTNSPEEIELSYVNIRENLHRLTDVDYIIIGKREFKSSFDRYIQFRSNRFPAECDTLFCISNGRVRYVALEDIFEQFALGSPDPVAIRNFLYNLHSRYPDLLYALFVGDATYDYRGYITTEGNLFPVYYDVREVYDINRTGVGSVDDFYGDFDGDGYSDIYIGRIPIRSTGEISRIIDRIINYETGRFFSHWKNRIMLVADDFQGSSPCEITWHLVPSDLIRRHYLPVQVEAWKLYLHEYPSEGGAKPQATADFVQKYNQGNLVVNIFAHGNPSTITGERLITLDNVHLLNAEGHNPFVMVLSCKVSVFDRINFAGPRGLGEKMFIQEGGAIGVLGATALSYVSGNQMYANAIFNALKSFNKYPMGYLAMLNKSNRYYVLFGDPAVLLGYEKPDSNLMAPDSAFVGTLYSANLMEELRYFGSLGFTPDSITVTNCSYTYTYLNEDRSFFRAPIHSDSLRAIIPKNTPVARKIRLRALYRGGIKFRDSISVAFDPERLSPDSTGPEIRLILGGREVRDSMRLSSTGVLRVRLSDESGIYLSPGERDIEVYLDGSRITTLTNSFAYYQNSYTEGEARYDYDFSRNQGWHTLTIKAWDNYDNLSTRSYFLYLGSASLDISDFLIYPNPFKGGNLYFTFTSTSEATGRILVYDLNGNLVHSTPRAGIRAGFNTFVWNNARLGSGLYIAVLKVSKNGIKKMYRNKLVVVK